MATDQLERVAQWEKDKEDQCAKVFQQAQQYLFEHQQRLGNIERYRTEYLDNIHNHGNTGLGARDYTQKLSFIAQLDNACVQQNQIISQAILVADQRKQEWLAQQCKRKAVDYLIDKRRKQQIKRAEKREQQLLDEFALHSFLRNR